MANCLQSPSSCGLLSINCISPVGKYSTRVYMPKVQSRTALPFLFFLVVCIPGPWSLTDHLTQVPPSAASLSTDTNPPPPASASYLCKAASGPCNSWWDALSVSTRLQLASAKLGCKSCKKQEMSWNGNEGWDSNTSCSGKSCWKARSLPTASEYGPIVKTPSGIIPYIHISCIWGSLAFQVKPFINQWLKAQP